MDLSDSRASRPVRARLARLNRVGLNRVTRRVFPYLPGFGVVLHRGRRSGTIYRTPVNVFERPHGYIVALTYGSDTDWVKNVVAAGGCQLQTRGRTVSLQSPRLYRDETRQGIRAFERQLLRALRVTEFLELEANEPGTARGVVQRLLAGIAAGPTDALADLYAADAVVELPFATPGGLRLIGREEIRQHFARAGQAPLRLQPDRVVLHETTDPEVVVAEYDYRGEAAATGRTFVVSNVQIVRVENGLIVTSRDFHDHARLAEALRP